MNRKLNVLIAVDSFKGSLTSLQVASALERGIKKIDEDIIVEKTPLADGGEGTVESIVSYANGSYINEQVKDPLMRDIVATYGLVNDGRTAIIEMASASGIGLLDEDEKNPLITTTYGTGQLIRDALEKGCENFLIGIGGSATNDGGVGMAMALGARFLDSEGENISHEPRNFHNINFIDFSQMDSRIKNVKISVLCDVNNPLIGENGASHVYGPQKGADMNMVRLLDNNLKHLADIAEKELGTSFRNIPGTGAAGGLGFGLVAFLGARLLGGINFLVDFVNLEEKIIESDIVITGEGRVDFQTKFNKLPVGIAELAHKHNKKTVCIAGQIDESAWEMKGNQFDEIFSIMEDGIKAEDAIKNAADYLEKIVFNKMKNLFVD